MIALLLGLAGPASGGAHDHGPGGAPDPSGAREASGTAWQPAAAGMEGLHLRAGPWSIMLHGSLDLAYAAEGGPRGTDEAFFTNMLMAMGRRPAGPGNVRVRAMASVEPLLGPSGYPLLLQTGETADGRTNLFDRQHPHDAAMELSASYDVRVRGGSVFLYAGLPGEPALGPPAFMHRASGADFPTAPLGHHWMDATHLSYGVVTAGVTAGPVKLDASAFNGREPDEKRWGFETHGLGSRAVRATVSPRPALALQASWGRLAGPEVLHPGVDVTRWTASASLALGPPARHLDAMLAWGRNRRSRLLSTARYSRYGPERTEDALLFESALRLGPRNTILARAEWAEKDELFPITDAFHARVFPVGKLEAGYVRELARPAHIGLSLGATASVALAPEFLEPDYGRRPWSVVVFARARR